MRRTFTVEQITGRARVHPAGYVFDVRLADGSVGRVLVPELEALQRDGDALNDWIVEQLRRRLASWSYGVVVGRMLGRDGLELDDESTRANLGSDWLVPAAPNQPVAKRRRRAGRSS